MKRPPRFLTWFAVSASMTDEAREALCALSERETTETPTNADVEHLEDLGLSMSLTDNSVH